MSHDTHSEASSPELSANGKAALEYLQQGYCPIPVKEDKSCFIKWKPYQKRLPTKQEIIEWWTKYPNANIALVCGHNNLAVFDIDVKGQPPKQKKLADKIAADFKTKSRTVGSPSDGYHIYFFETERKSTSEALPGLGDLQAEARYVVAPPSKNYSLLSDLEPLAVPNAREFIADYLGKFGINLQSHSKQPENKEAGSIPEGSRNIILTSVAGFARAKGFSEEVINQALQALNNQCQPPLTEKEVSGIAKSIAKYPSNPASHLEAGSLEVKRVNAYELRKKSLENQEELQYLPLLGQKRFLVEGWSHIIAGQPKVGKTELITSLCEEWQHTNNQILYFTEEPESIWAARLRQRTSKLQSVNLVIALGLKAEQILAEISTAPEDIIIIDTARNLLGLKDETDNSAVAQALNPFIGAARQANKTIIFSHHIRKGGGKYGEGITGAHAFLGVVDIALEVHRAEAQKQRKVLGFGRVIEIPELLYERQGDDSLIALGSPEQVTLDVVKDRLLEALSEDWQTTKEIYDSLSRPTPSSEQVRQALNSLAQEKLIERDPLISEGAKKGQTYRWRLAQPNKKGL